MNQSYVLDDLGETLKGLLREVLCEDGLISPDTKIDLGDLEEPSDMELELKIFVFGVQEQTEMRNLPPAVADGAAGDYVVRPAPNYLMVDLLVIPSKSRPADNLKVATRVLQAFFDRPVIRGPFLRGGLAGSDAELRVLLHPISLDDLTKLWSSFPDTKFRLSLCYRVYNVPLDSRREEPGVAVKSIESEYGEGVKKETEA